MVGRCLGAGMALAGEWPQFRGPQSAGVAETAFPTEWGPDKNVEWKVKIPGLAWSSPIVWGDKVFLTTATTENQTRPQPARRGIGRRRRRNGSWRHGTGRNGRRNRPLRRPPGTGPNLASLSQESARADRGPEKERRRAAKRGRRQTRQAAHRRTEKRTQRTRRGGRWATGPIRRTAATGADPGGPRDRAAEAE